MIYKTLKKVSNVCQLLDKSKYPATKTINGVTFTNNGDGTITANGTATSRAVLLISKEIPVIYGKGLIIGEPQPDYAFINYTFYNNKEQWIADNASFGGNGVIFTGRDDAASTELYIAIEAGNTANNLVFKPQLFDLTEMYGAGNEPTTVEQFRQDFPEELYDYKPYCFVKSYKNCLKVNEYCQLVDKRKFPETTTTNGITFANNGDGTITANGTAIKDTYFTILSADLELSTHKKYLLTGCPSGGSSYTYFLYLDRDGALFNIDTGNGSIGTPTKSNAVITIFVRQGLTLNNLIFKPQIFDLTEMYGVGNEPTTVEEFREKFPNELYDYKPYSIITSYKKSLACKTKNLLDISKVFSEPTLCFDVSSLEIGQTYTFSSNKPIKTFKISNNRQNYNSVYFTNPGFGFTTFTFVMARDEHISVNAKQYLFLYLFELTSDYVTDISQLNGYNLQIELGDTATDYVPYGHL